MTKLDARRKEILRAIIQSHIDLNIPVGSKLITQRFPIGLSPATIRNTMAKLEETGYITRTHASAGRIPTEKGYRFYVDALMNEQSLSINLDFSKKLTSRLHIIREDSKTLIKEAARSLSFFSHYLAIATPPKIEDILLKRIKFIKYEKRKVLAVIISRLHLQDYKVHGALANAVKNQVVFTVDFIENQPAGKIGYAP